MVERFGHRFGDQALRDQALRHRSAGTPHNERLEFLGDALVNLIVAEALYARWPDADEGGLTRARAALVTDGEGHSRRAAEQEAAEAALAIIEAARAG